MIQRQWPLLEKTPTKNKGKIDSKDHVTMSAVSEEEKKEEEKLMLGSVDSSLLEVAFLELDLLKTGKISKDQFISSLGIPVFAKYLLQQHPKPTVL